MTMHIFKHGHVLAEEMHVYSTGGLTCHRKIRANECCSGPINHRSVVLYCNIFGCTFKLIRTI